MAEARERSRAPAGRWPGWNFDSAPIAARVAEGTLLWNHPAPPEGFVRWSPAEPVPLPGSVYLGPAMTTANTATDFGGQRTATLRLDGDIAPRRAARLLLHEAFHVFQQGVRPGSGVPFARTAFYPELSAVNNALARAENLVLAEFLAATLPAEDAARDVRALRATRYACADEEWPAYEDACEWYEGGAQLAEALAFGEEVQHEVVAALRRDNLGGAGAAYGRFYASGAGLGLLLASLNTADWQDRWLATAPFGAVAACGGAADPREALQRWNVTALLVEEAASRSRRLTDARAALASLTPSLVVAFAAAPPLSQMFNPQRLQVVGTGRRLHLGLLRLDGPGWVFATDEGPVLEDLSAQRLVLRMPNGVNLVDGEGRIELPFLQAARARTRPAAGGGWTVEVLPEQG